MKQSYHVPRVEGAPDWEALPALELAHTGWLEPCAVSARARLCHDGAVLRIRMEAEEDPIRATFTGKLDHVSDDSCLEFFLAPGGPGDPRYFNFEFNPLGAMNLSFGGARPNRVRQVPKDAGELLGIRPFSRPGGWGIEFQISAAFVGLYLPGFAFSGELEGNFYKCGDLTEAPHFLAWSPLSSDTPDFHRRQDFGRLIFD